ncbi:ExbD/TolR family protein [Peristeroidobacter agariperforans]|uniref:ExbD/TolR family protein n=1 Tax=Peristeroidobacter agariperforans TaxID=268404 RepID=UPI00101D5309|nr:biopolymer transporter ExbD [Peristeroidobacter agariperforans]
MAMSVSASASGEPLVDMNTTPLIDVMLVLLIMFIITLPVVTNNIKLDLPVKPDGKAATTEKIDLTIDYDGTILWNGAVIESLAQLEQYFRAEAARPNQPELHVRPDKRAKYDYVAQVLGSAQRSGMQRIGFAGQEQFIEK